MRLGDLVKFKKQFRGLDDMSGIIIAENGNAFDILWSRQLVPPFGQGPPKYIQTELPEYLEVFNETR